MISRTLPTKATVAFVDIIALSHGKPAIAYLAAFFQRQRGLAIFGYVISVEDTATGERAEYVGSSREGLIVAEWKRVSGLSVTVSALCEAADEARRGWSEVYGAGIRR